MKRIISLIFTAILLFSLCFTQVACQQPGGNSGSSSINQSSGGTNNPGNETEDLPSGRYTYEDGIHVMTAPEVNNKFIVENGATVVDVFIIHNAYGKLSAPLNISTPAQVEQFMETLRSGKSSELMHITGGTHHHTVRAENEEILDKVEAALKAAGYIVA